MLERVAVELFALIDESCAPSEGSEPLTQIETGLGALLSWVAAEPSAAQALIVEAPSGPEEAFDLHLGVLAGFAERLDRNSPGEAALPGPVAELIVGGIVSILRGTLIAGDAKRAPALLPGLLAYLRQPYLMET